MDDQAFLEFLIKVFTYINNYLIPGGPFYICVASSTLYTFLRALAETDMIYKQLLIWIKQRITLVRSDYNYKHEVILYGWRGGGGHKWYGTYNNTTVIDDNIDIDKLTKKELQQLLRDLLDQIPIDVIHVDRAAVNELHPTTKPIPLITPMIINSSQQGDIVLDPFGGSGSTLIACEETGRRCYMLELDPHYIDVIIERWEKHTGRKSKLISG